MMKDHCGTSHFPLTFIDMAVLVSTSSFCLVIEAFWKHHCLGLWNATATLKHHPEVQGRVSQCCLVLH
ncbi:hypothetical protein BDZ94DRAFT_1266064 [Collybia nuda]|uniref:Uncharacterized protein n=1 Tax=Collybia nuda TaxID=64659 RepID=A0A9P6CC86_9AGAR|nr:hypothetical protein BDZ94DRAFT_1266064 [Collybia nuda]